MKELKYKYKKGYFTGIIHPDDQLQLLYNGNHLCYIDLDNHENFGKIPIQDLFKEIVEDLLADNMSDLIEEIYFQNKEWEYEREN